MHVIPPMRKSVLSLEEPAECLVKDEEEMEKKEQSKKKRKVRKRWMPLQTVKDVHVLKNQDG